MLRKDVSEADFRAISLAGRQQQLEAEAHAHENFVCDALAQFNSNFDPRAATAAEEYADAMVVAHTRSMPNFSSLIRNVDEINDEVEDIKLYLNSRVPTLQSKLRKTEAKLAATRSRLESVVRQQDITDRNVALAFFRIRQLLDGRRCCNCCLAARSST